MSTHRNPNKSQGASITPTKPRTRLSRSIGSPARSVTGRLSTIVDQFKENHLNSFKISPLTRRRSVLTDDTDIERPGRPSWWKQLNEKSTMEVFDNDNGAGQPQTIEDFMEVDVLSQEKKNYTLDLPESSDSESINSIVIPQRKLFTEKNSHTDNKFGQIIGKSESLSKLQKTNVDIHDKTINVKTKTLFNQQKKTRTKPQFPSNLLNISDKTINKTKEMGPPEIKGQTRNLFGQAPTKRKNMFADFIVSESEDEIPEIEPRVFGFKKKIDRRGSSTSRGREPSPSSSVTTDIDVNDWKLLPSSTMVDHQIEALMISSPINKKSKLSILSEAKESDATKLSNTLSNASKNSSKLDKQKNISVNKTKGKSFVVMNIEDEPIFDDFMDVPCVENQNNEVNNIETEHIDRNKTLVAASNNNKTSVNKSNDLHLPKDVNPNVSKISTHTPAKVSHKQKNTSTISENQNKNLSVNKTGNIANTSNNFVSSTKDFSKQKNNSSLSENQNQNSSVNKTKDKTYTLPIDEGESDKKCNPATKDSNNTMASENQTSNISLNKTKNKTYVIPNTVNSGKISNLETKELDNLITTSMTPENRSISLDKTNNKTFTDAIIEEDGTTFSNSLSKYRNKSKNSFQISEKENKSISMNKSKIISFTVPNTEENDIILNQSKYISIDTEKEGKNIQKPSNDVTNTENNLTVVINSVEKYANQMVEKPDQVNNLAVSEVGINRNDTTVKKTNANEFGISPEMVETNTVKSKPVFENVENANNLSIIKEVQEKLIDKTVEQNICNKTGETDKIIINIDKETSNPKIEGVSDKQNDATIKSNLNLSKINSEINKSTQKVIDGAQDDRTYVKNDNNLIGQKDADISNNITNTEQNADEINQEVDKSQGEAGNNERDDEQGKNQSEEELDENNSKDEIEQEAENHSEEEREQEPENQSEDEIEQDVQNQSQEEIVQDVENQSEEEIEDEAENQSDNEMEEAENQSEDEIEQEVDWVSKEDMEQHNQTGDENEKESNIQSEEEIEQDVDKESEEEMEQDAENESQEEIEQDIDKESEEEMEQEVENQSEIEQDVDKESEEEMEQEAENESQEGIEQDTDKESEEEMEQEVENQSEEEFQNESAQDISNEELYQQDVENDIDEDEIEVPQNLSQGDENEDSHNIKNHVRVDSPEAILEAVPNSAESFKAKGRNTSIRKTKSVISKSLHIRPSMAPRNSIGEFTDGSRNSSAEGSGWDSHRTTRKTLRQTFGKDFTPRKSLRALVMEKSAKRQTAVQELQAESLPRANSTEFPQDSEHYEDTIEPSNHEESIRLRRANLETRLKQIKKDNMEMRQKIADEVKRSLKRNHTKENNIFKVPSRPIFRKGLSRPKESKEKKSTRPALGLLNVQDLPIEFQQDLAYKPPKRFQPRNAPWITKRLYSFLETRLESKYDYKARVRAEKLTETLYNFAKLVKRHDFAPQVEVDKLKVEMARLNIVKTHFDFYQFVTEFMPRDLRIKINPDAVNGIPVPRSGVFSDILVRDNTVRG